MITKEDKDLAFDHYFENDALLSVSEVVVIADLRIKDAWHPMLQAIIGENWESGKHGC